jgi:hypothetical protein
MLFRPEEVHARSAKGPRFRRSPNGAVGVAYDRRGLYGRHLFVAHFHHHGFAAIQTRCINANRLAGEEPAHGQRFEPSLREPLLVAVDGDAVLRGLIVERRKRSDVIGLRMKPPGDAGSHYVDDQLAAFLHRKVEVLGELGVVGRLSRVDEASNDAVKGAIEKSHISHVPPHRVLRSTGDSVQPRAAFCKNDEHFLRTWDAGHRTPFPSIGKEMGNRI